MWVSRMLEHPKESSPLFRGCGKVTFKRRKRIYSAGGFYVLVTRRFSKKSVLALTSTLSWRQKNIISDCYCFRLRNAAKVMPFQCLFGLSSTAEAQSLEAEGELLAIDCRLASISRISTKCCLCCSAASGRRRKGPTHPTSCRERSARQSYIPSHTPSAPLYPSDHLLQT